MTSRTLLLCSFLALGIAACGDKTPGTPSRDSGTVQQTPAAGTTTPAAGETASTTTPGSAATPSPGSSPANPAADPAMRPDTADGTLLVKGSGAASGEWKMFDATGRLSEEVRSGSTVTVLSIEGHRGNPDATLSIRLTSNKAITAGRYGIDQESSPVRVDARWDLKGEMYRALNGTKASGWVEIASLTTTHVRGSYNLTLPAIMPGGPDQTVSGTFDQELIGSGH